MKYRQNCVFRLPLEMIPNLSEETNMCQFWNFYLNAQLHGFLNLLYRSNVSSTSILSFLEMMSSLDVNLRRLDWGLFLALYLARFLSGRCMYFDLFYKTKNFLSTTDSCSWHQSFFLIEDICNSMLWCLLSSCIFVILKNQFHFSNTFN